MTPKEIKKIVEEAMAGLARLKETDPVKYEASVRELTKKIKTLADQIESAS